MLGAGAVGTVSALKFVQDAMLEQLVIADAVSARASLLADRLCDPRVSFRRLDAGDRTAVADAIRDTGTTILLNAALPATNLEVMRACLEAGSDYIDMASGGTEDDGIPKLDDQFALDAECLCKAVSYRDGLYHLENPLTGFEPFDFPELGVLNCYYVDHEESRTLPRFFPAARTIDFKLCMDDATLETLRVMKRLGLSRTDRVTVGDVSLAPRDLVVSLLPEPKDLAGRMRGKTCVGTLAKGLKNGLPKAYYIYNVADHEAAFAELGVQATAYQTGIPPVIAARLIAQKVWQGSGVMSPEQFDPDPFLECLSREG